MDAMKFLASPHSKTFSEAVSIDTGGATWIFVSGQVGVPLPPTGDMVSFKQEVRTCFERIRDSLQKLGVGMDTVVSIKTYLTDLAPYAEFSAVRGEFFPNNPPTSTAVQVAGLLLGARVEIDAVAVVVKG